MRKQGTTMLTRLLVDTSYLAVGGWLTALVLGYAGAVQAHDGHDHGTATHGGTVAETPHYQFEVVFRKDGVGVYPLGKDGKPVAVGLLAGTATFYHPSTPRAWFSRPLRPVAAGPLAAPLGVAIDLSNVPATGAKVTFQVTCLPDPNERSATFTLPFSLAHAGEITVTKATHADQKDIALQKVCPVSHEELGSMGVPLKVSRGGRSILLCCQGCLKEVQAHPDKYFGTELTVTKATRADQAAISAQKTCPVSREPLGSMGTPIKVARGDRNVFLCCQACIKKVQANPDQYLGPQAAASGAK